ncbi:hypothetical protein I3842_09G177700 [Carya illinoinensis]|uniref:Uncharacterized protein n=1 Tax=Carya illinoinensis TaxID=32201 RepID=A0A922E580_CARIL|nr:hypothetical protein I3842_09G177700 [Carya illinoinensis]
MELHQKKISNKYDHLVLGPAAGQGLPNRLQCEGVKALNKTHFSTSHLSGGRETIAFVTVFAIYNPPLNSLADDRSSNLITVGNSSYGKVERSMALLNIFINVIQVTMPQSNIVILTELVSDLRMRRNRVTVHPVQGEYSRDKLMLQRIRSYIAYPETRLGELSHKEHVTHYIFTDSDIAVVDDLGQIFPDYSSFIRLSLLEQQSTAFKFRIHGSEGYH